VESTFPEINSTTSRAHPRPPARPSRPRRSARP